MFHVEHLFRLTQVFRVGLGQGARRRELIFSAHRIQALRLVRLERNAKTRHICRLSNNPRTPSQSGDAKSDCTK